MTDFDPESPLAKVRVKVKVNVKVKVKVRARVRVRVRVRVRLPLIKYFQENRIAGPHFCRCQASASACKLRQALSQSMITSMMLKDE